MDNIKTYQILNITARQHIEQNYTDQLHIITLFKVGIVVLHVELTNRTAELFGYTSRNRF